MATYVKLIKLGLVKGSGKQNVDDAALDGLKSSLSTEMTKLGYDFDAEDGKPKQKKGFVLDGSITEIFITPVGSRATVGVKISMSLGTLPDNSMFGFLTSSPKVDSGTRDKDIEGSVVAVVAAAAAGLAQKIDAAIKNKQGAGTTGS